MADGSIKIDAKIDDSTIDKQLKGIKANITQGMQSAAKIANVALAGIVASIGAIGVASMKFIKTTDRIDKMSQSLGVSRRGFQELDYALSQSGASIDSMGMAMRTMTEAITSNSDSFKILGVSVNNADGTLKTQEQILKESIIAMQGLEEGVEKTALANKLFGRSSQDLMPLLNSSVGSFEQLTARAAELGLVIGDDAVNAGVVLGDTLDDLKKAGEAVLTNVLAPFIPSITKMIEGFIKWATEGDRIKNIMTNVANVIKTAWESGLIPGILAAVGAIKLVTIAMAAFNVVANANPVSIMVVAIGALITAVVMLYKNWDQVVLFFQQSGARIGAMFQIIGSKIGEAFKIGVNVAIIAMTSMVNFLYGSVLKGVESLIRAMGQLPFVGHLFEKAADAVGFLGDKLQDITDEIKDDSAQAIQAAKDKQDAIEASVRAQLQAYLEESNARNGVITDMEAEAVKANELKTSINGVTSEKENAIEVQAILDKQRKTELTLQNKLNDGIITEEQHRQELESALQQNIDSLYELGYSMGSVDTAGGEMLASFRTQVKGLKITAMDTQDAGEQINKSMSKGLTETAHTVLGVAGQIAGIVMSIFKIDPATVYGSIKTFVETIAKFLFVNLGNMPTFWNMGMALLVGLANDIQDNLPKLIITMKNVVGGMAKSIVDNGFLIAQTAIQLILGLAQSIVSNLPIIVKGAGQIILGIITGLLQALPDLLIAFGQMMPQLVAVFSELFPLVILAILENLPAIIEAFSEAFPLLSYSIAMLLPLVLIEIAKHADEIIIALVKAIILSMIASRVGLLNAFIELGTIAIEALRKALESDPEEIGKGMIDGLVSGIISAANEIWGKIESVFTGLINNIKTFFGIHSPSTLFADMGGMMIQGLINGILNAGSGLWNAVSGVFSGLVSNVNSVLSGIGSTIATGVGGVVGAASGAGGGIIGGIAGVATGIGGAIASGVGGIINSLPSPPKINLPSPPAIKKFWRTGADYVTSDTDARIHQGERVTPRTQNQELMSGSMMMLAPKALASILSGAGAGLGSKVIQIHNVMTGTIDVDGRSIGRVAFENLDRMAAQL